MYSAIIVAAGRGTRAELTFNKIFYNFNGKSLLDFTIQPFENDKDCDRIILVISTNDLSELKKSTFSSKVEVVIGGETRQESVLNGLNHVHTKIVFIHDGARPNLHPLYIEKCKSEIKNHEALTLAIPVKDTLKVTKDNYILSTVDRNLTVQLQTPQVFYTLDIIEAHNQALKRNHHYTDDATLLQEELGKNVFIVSGDEYNIKATTKIDLMILEDLLCTK